MKKYYTTMSPDAARHILLTTKQEAIDEAKNKVMEDDRVRYVAMILYKIEPDTPPVKVTRIK